MCAFAITYRSAFDIKRFGTASPIKHESILIAPSNWDTDEVIDAFINQHPGSTVISCTRAPLPQIA